MGGQFFIAKYSFEFKKKVIEAYLNGEDNYPYLAKKYAIPNPEQIRRWTKAYEAMGNDGLML